VTHFQMKVRIGSEVFLYDEKAPYEKSGFGERGALRLDPDTDMVMCHECGAWFQNIGGHSNSAHGITARQYKEKHGFFYKTALCSEGYRLLRSRLQSERVANGLVKFPNKETLAKATRAAGKARRKGKRLIESLNMTGHCMAQVLSEVRELAAKLKRTPTLKEIETELGIWHPTLSAHFGSIPAMMEAAGLIPRKSGEHWRPRKPRSQQYSRDQLMFFLVNFIKQNKRRAVRSDCRRGFLPSPHTFARRFGSWARALKMADKLAREAA
jgi:Homing endonuclease associated repeat/ROS/MUCR transcriptional regulator protein